VDERRSLGFVHVGDGAFAGLEGLLREGGREGGGGDEKRSLGFVHVGNGAFAGLEGLLREGGREG